ncbi:hypothetical protein ABE65_017430 [Fictibacillus phosphorivorans]|uniref:GGDEF domain-containing protein n=1 Tax=Fictibacillus phosphorivorans TaxID=1221500 RepID=A0A168W857_9BACL|nr:diguanylate cyclase [Fictibacillus phosphorivorans]ANC78485.1 hypothetical protein ABE65_017430 [Fictibacillus phosphorivorans]
MLINYLITTYIHNLTLIVTFLFLVTKLGEYMNHNLRHRKNFYFSILYSMMAIIIMTESYQLDGVLIDLRAAPLLIFAYISGWYGALFSSLIVSIARYFMGEPNVWLGISSILYVSFIGALFHYLHGMTPYDSRLSFKRVSIVFLVFQLTGEIIMYIASPFTPKTLSFVNFHQTLFCYFAILAMVYIINNAHFTLNFRKTLEYQSTHDFLTGLPNISYFRKHVDSYFQNKISVCIVMMDIDYFKTYNDTNGHLMGDRTLREISTLFLEHKRSSDFIARYGGEEFIICIPNPDPNEVISHLTALINKVEDFIFLGEESQPQGKLTISVGASLASIQDEKSLEQLIFEADHALYTSKKEGRNRLTIYQTLNLDNALEKTVN